ncbi:MAG: FAD-binding oxidoreductase [Planctomycetales bacterium]
MAVTEDDFTPATQAELARFVAENAAGERRVLYPEGGRTRLSCGYPPVEPGVTLSTAALARVIDYPARDMTVTVEAGMRVEELATLLREERQQLPIDVPQPHRATLGGAVAMNACGPRRFGHGTLRDYVIGVSAVDAHGRLFKSGGRVVKNVAGYDLAKLLVGSMGTLAIVTQLTFKLRPLPEAAAIVWAALEEFYDLDVVLERLLTSATRPVLLEVLGSDAAREIAAEARSELPSGAPVLAVGFEGTAREVEWQAARVREELSAFGPREIGTVEGEPAERLRSAFTEFELFADAPLTFRASLPPSWTIPFLDRAARAGVTVQAHAGNGIVTGHLPDDAVTLEKAESILGQLREFAREARGHLTIVDCPPDWKRRLPLFGAPDQSWELMRRVKRSLDPHDLLNRGRLFRNGDDDRAAGERSRTD